MHSSSDPAHGQVSDCLTGNIATSTVFQAFDYATRMGAHIVSASIGTTYEWGFTPTGPAPAYHSQWQAAYVSAMQPMSSKGVLAVVAAGGQGGRERRCPPLAASPST
jgi:hypothetical protein